MKKLILTATAALILSLGSAAMAGDEATIDIADSVINQLQQGHELDQMAVMGLVTNDYAGDAMISIKESFILQVQSGHHNNQEAQMGVIGCDCGDGKKNH